MTLAATSSPSSVRAAFEDRLASLRQHAFKYFKLGTEVEALSFAEIACTRNVLPPDVAVYVKIGGPGAMNDIRELAAIGVEGLIAPMIESPFGLQNFLQAIDAALDARQADAIVKGINLETTTCHRAFDAIAAEPGFARLGLCNIGRSDLAASMGRKVTDPEVEQAVCELIRGCRARGMSVHVGGQVTGPTVEAVLAREPPDGFHTRFLAFSGEGGSDAVASAIASALELEIAYLDLLAEQFPGRARLHVHRRDVTAERLDQHRRWTQARKPSR